MRLIDADKFERRMRKYAEDCYEAEDAVSAQVFEDVVCEIQDEKSVDAVEVVRCFDCRHYGNEDKRPCGGDCAFHGSLVDRDDFCSYGERKESIQ